MVEVRSRMARGILCALCLSAAACREAPALIELPPLHPIVDAGLLPDGGRPLPPDAVACQTAQDCDDGVACTVDACAPLGYCVARRSNERCSDGVFCNGEEICDSAMGCLLPSAPRSCSDGDVCTLDSCDEVAARCLHVPRDSDGDGEVDIHCAGGRDCDDLDPTVGSARGELCGDGQDNDCDGDVDEEDCGVSAHDRCGDAYTLSAAQLRAGTAVELALAGATRDYALGCDPESTGDVALSFVLEAASDVDIRVAGVLAGGGEEIAAASLRADGCGAAAVVDCVRGFPAWLRSRALPAGRYYLVVDSRGAASVVVSVAAAAATEGPDNLQCASAQPIEGELQSVKSDFVDVSDDYTAPCADATDGAPASQPDLVYAYTLSQPQDVSFLLSSPGGDALTLSVRRECEQPDSTLACRVGAPVVARLHQQPPGDYYVIVESPSYREVDFDFELRVEAPTPPPEGDTCDVAAELPLSTTLSASLKGKQPGVDASCHEDFLAPDMVFRLSLAKRSNVTIRADGVDATLRLAVQEVCGDPTTERRCQRGRPTHVTLYDLPAGDYYVAIDGPLPVDFSLRATASAPTPPTPVEGNDDCASAFPIPAGGGVFVGDTSAHVDDFAGCVGSALPDAVYRLSLDQESLVTLHLQADFDTVVYRFAASCGGAVADCNDDDGEGTGDSELQALLPAGDYYFVVDGRSGETAGPYTLEVIVD